MINYFKILILQSKPFDKITYQNKGRFLIKYKLLEITWQLIILIKLHIKQSVNQTYKSKNIFPMN